MLAVVRMVLRGKRILILESDYIVAHAIQRVLENEGAAVHVGPCIGALAKTVFTLSHTRSPFRPKAG
jgi:hypothetical protein